MNVAIVFPSAAAMEGDKTEEVVGPASVTDVLVKPLDAFPLFIAIGATL